jgi:hypothetical protein
MKISYSLLFFVKMLRSQREISHHHPVLSQKLVSVRVIRMKKNKVKTIS